MTTDVEAIRAALKRHRQDEQLFMELSSLVAATVRHTATEFRASFLAFLSGQDPLSFQGRVVKELTSM